MLFTENEQKSLQNMNAKGSINHTTDQLLCKMANV